VPRLPTSDDLATILDRRPRLRRHAAAHAPQTSLAALGAGAAVLSEKPLAASMGAARELVAAADRAAAC
jgi:hypothetical protein